MTDVTVRSDFDVTLIDSMGDDHRICQAARISTEGADTMGVGESYRLIAFLMGVDRDGGPHGSPFEHVVMQWLITAPIFVWREFHRHRIASYNEQSSRWTQLDPVFYVPGPGRPAFKAPGSRTGDYKNGAAETPEQATAYEVFRANLRTAQQSAYDDYEHALMTGVAKEVARMGLPVSVYSTCFVTMNARALMNFLSLRTDETAQWEIRQVALAMEEDFKERFPHVHQAWVANGRVAP